MVSLQSFKRLGFLLVTVCAFLCLPIYLKITQDNRVIQFQQVEKAREQGIKMDTCEVKFCPQSKRIKNLREICEKHPEIAAGFDPKNKNMYTFLMVDDKHKVLYCMVPKAASTTMRYILYLSVAGPQPDRSYWLKKLEKHGILSLSSFTEKEREWRLRNYYKIIVVRHPMDRFVSCWNNKLAEESDNDVYKKLAPQMVEMFRDIPEGTSIENELQKGISFEEFVQYVRHIEMTSKNHNQHWRPIYQLCHPCSIDYDLIGKTETLNHDLNIILHHFGLTDIGVPSFNTQRREENETLQMNRYLNIYKNVLDHLEGITRFYELDMELFDYKWNGTQLEARCGDHCDKNDNVCC